jgi:hypothetical protein
MGRHFTQYSTHRCYTHLLLLQRTRTSVHTFRFQPDGRFRLSPDKVVEHRRAYACTPCRLAGRLSGSNPKYWSSVGSCVNSGAAAIIKTYKTHIYSCTQKWLYANAKLRTVKRLVARMIFTDSVRMSRSWFTVKDNVYRVRHKHLTVFWNSKTSVPAKRCFCTDHHNVQWCLELAKTERWSVQNRLAVL